MTRLVIARHGNTFESGQTPTRVGARTDLPLTAKGRAQAARIGAALAERGWTPTRILAGPLSRTRQSADEIVSALGPAAPAPVEDPRLREIDYGPDENRPEAAVEERLGRLRFGAAPCAADEARAAGRAVIDAWNAGAAVPDGWLVDPDALARMWRALAAEAVAAGPGACWLAVTSNGVARFAASLCAVRPAADLKIAPGAVCVFEYADGAWRCVEWNVRP